MPIDPEHSQFQEWFSELKREDQSETPSFHGAWHAALKRRQRSGSRTNYRWRVAAAVVLLALLGIIATSLRPVRHGWVGANPSPHSTKTSIPNTSVPSASITEWQSPTAFLLDMAADEKSLPAS